MRNAQPLHAEIDGNSVTPDPSDGGEQEPGEEREEELDGEAGHDSEDEETPE